MRLITVECISLIILVTSEEVQQPHIDDDQSNCDAVGKYANKGNKEQDQHALQERLKSIHPVTESFLCVQNKAKQAKHAEAMTREDLT